MVRVTFTGIVAPNPWATSIGSGATSSVTGVASAGAATRPYSVIALVGRFDCFANTTGVAATRSIGPSGPWPRPTSFTGAAGKWASAAAESVSVPAAWPAAIAAGRTVRPAGGPSTVTVIGPEYPLRLTVTPTATVPPRGTLTSGTAAASSKSGAIGSATIRYGKPTPPRRSRSRITTVISFVPLGTVVSIVGSGRMSDCAMPFLGGRAIVVSSALAIAAPPFPSTRSTGSSAEPSSYAWTLIRTRDPGVTARANRSSSPAGSIRPFSATGATAWRIFAAGSAGSRNSAYAETTRDGTDSKSRSGWPGRQSPVIAAEIRGWKASVPKAARTVAAATLTPSSVPPRSSKPTVSPARPPSGKTSSAIGTSPTTSRYTGRPPP